MRDAMHWQAQSNHSSGRTQPAWWKSASPSHCLGVRKLAPENIDRIVSGTATVGLEWETTKTVGKFLNAAGRQGHESACPPAR
jgi:hypothetical protein